jgi:hypothetical protein
VRAVLGQYQHEHGESLTHAVEPIDAIVVVPPAGHRAPPHPLEGVVNSLALDVPVLPLLARGPGALGFRVASRDGSCVAVSMPTQRVLLVEDAFVTGARLFSAARALIDGGHVLAGALAMARRIYLPYGDCEQLWLRQRAAPFDWRTSPLTTAPDNGLLEFAPSSLSVRPPEDIEAPRPHSEAP